MIYLCSPYSDLDPAVRDQRVRAACRATAALLHAGENVLSPIVHSFALVEFDLPTDWNYWQRLDTDMLARCDEVVVLMLDGWERSVGVSAEIGLARELGKRVRYIHPASATVSPTFAPVALEGTS